MCSTLKVILIALSSVQLFSAEKTLSYVRRWYGWIQIRYNSMIHTLIALYFRSKFTDNSITDRTARVWISCACKMGDLSHFCTFSSHLSVHTSFTHYKIKRTRRKQMENNVGYTYDFSPLIITLRIVRYPLWFEYKRTYPKATQRCCVSCMCVYVCVCALCGMDMYIVCIWMWTHYTKGTKILFGSGNFVLCAKRVSMTTTTNI